MYLGDTKRLLHKYKRVLDVQIAQPRFSLYRKR